MRALKKIVASPYLNFLVGCILLYTGLAESWREFQALEEFRIGVHHGVVLFSLVQIAKTLPDMFEGMEYLVEAKEPG